MRDLIPLLITWLVTAISLFIVSKIPLIGVEIDSFNKALISAAVFGLLNAFVRPILAFLGAPITFLTLGLFTIILNGIMFGLAAWLVRGFWLRHGFVSAIIGALALTFVNSILFQVLAKVF